MNIKMSLVQTS